MINALMNLAVTEILIGTSILISEKNVIGSWSVLSCIRPHMPDYLPRNMTICKDNIENT